MKCREDHADDLSSTTFQGWCFRAGKPQGGTKMKTSMMLLSGLTIFVMACDSDSEAKKVAVSGIAYIKNSTTPVVGATVSIAESPTLTTTTDATGRWSLEVEEGASVTPFAVAEGFVTTHTETFEADSDLANVHFQMIPPTLFEVLAGALGIVPDPTKCQISTEVSDLMAQDLSFEALITERPHGVEGVSITMNPPGGPITFFEYGEPFDLPNAALTATTTSGGLVSTQVTPGVYTITATHPSRTFASIKVTCTAGRFINATTPRGLHETSP